MKRFSFSLQKLMDYKGQLLDIELTVLGDMRAALSRMQSELEGFRADHTRRSVQYREQLAVGVTAREIELHTLYIRILESNIDQKVIQIRLQQQAIDRQMDKVKDARLEIATMEKLKERKLEEYTYLAGKQDEQFIEEYVSTARAMEQHAG